MQNLIRNKVLKGRLADYHSLMGLSTKYVLKLAYNCKDLTELDMTHRANLTIKQIDLIGRICPKLKILIINSHVFEFSEGKKRLENKQLEEKLRFMEDNQDPSIQPIQQYFKNHASQYFPSLVANRILSLETLFVENNLVLCKPVTSVGQKKITPWYEEELESLYTKKSQLQCCIMGDGVVETRFGEFGSYNMINKEISLDEEDSDSENEINEDEIFSDRKKKIFKPCENIDSLDISDEFSVDDATWLSTILNAERCKNVTSLCLPHFNLSDDSFGVLNTCQLKLKFLSINGVRHFQYEELQKIFTSAFCKTVTSLELRRLEVIDITSLKLISGAFPNLERLRIDDFDDITDSFFDPLIKNEKILPKLEKLHITFEEESDDESERGVIQTGVEEEPIVEGSQISSENEDDSRSESGSSDDETEVGVVQTAMEEEPLDASRFESGSDKVDVEELLPGFQIPTSIETTEKVVERILKSVKQLCQARPGLFVIVDGDKYTNYGSNLLGNHADIKLLKDKET